MKVQFEFQRNKKAWKILKKGMFSLFFISQKIRVKFEKRGRFEKLKYLKATGLREIFEYDNKTQGLKIRFSRSIL